MNSNANEMLKRRTLGIILPSVFIILAMLPFFLFLERIPDPIVVHWGTDGRPNGSMRLLVIFITNLVFVGVPAVVMFFSSRRKPAYKGGMSRVISYMAFICTLTICTSWSTAYNNLDVSDWTMAVMKGGPMNWPRKLIPLKNIHQARAVDVVPMQHGDWGYRGSMKFRGCVSIVLRGGEGLELGLEGNKKLFITVDGAEKGAGLINDLIARV